VRAEPREGGRPTVDLIQETGGRGGFVKSDASRAGDIDAAETDAQWYADLYEVGWPDVPHRALRNSTAEVWKAAGRPPAGNPLPLDSAAPTGIDAHTGTSLRASCP
jgi:hypothetical protein